MTALDRPLMEWFPRIIDLPSGLKLDATMTPPGPVTEMDEERGVAALPGQRLAICLHPWARLGGNKEDPVLVALIHPLTHYHKFYVLRYNARGVGLSSGWKSFTGLQEAEDLRELVKYALKRLPEVREVALIVSIPIAPPDPNPNPPITTTSPPSQDLSLTATEKEGASMHPVLPAPVRTTHILISYPLGPRGLLTAFHSRTYQRALEDLVRQPKARVLLCQGDADDFTGAEAYDAWAEALGKLAVGDDAGSEGEDAGSRQEADGEGEDADANDGEGEGEGEGEEWPIEGGGNGLEVVRIPGASHFWGGQATRGLIESVTQFLT